MHHRIPRSLGSRGKLWYDGLVVVSMQFPPERTGFRMTDVVQVGMISAVLAASAGWWLYDGRPRERIPTAEGMDDVALAEQFADVSVKPGWQLFRRWLVRRALGLTSQGRAVDLGCGPGYLAVELAAQAPGLRVTGIDLSPVMLNRARAHTQLAGMEARVEFKQADAQRVPVPDHSYDLAVSSFALHHWADPVAVFNEVARIVRPGGSFLIRDLRRDLDAPSWLGLWFARWFLVPAALRQANEPLSSRDAAYTPQEAIRLAQQSCLSGWRVSYAPMWLTVEGTTVPDLPLQADRTHSYPSWGGEGAGPRSAGEGGNRP
jgi:ubiquinone/menaquinone biosynthesis C-methylase UbiE